MKDVQENHAPRKKDICEQITNLSLTLKSPMQPCQGQEIAF